MIVALFAVGVITGTILSFEMGLLWPNFTASVSLRGGGPAAGPLGLRLAAALLIVGIGLLNVASAPWAHALGVVSLFAFMLVAFPQIVLRALADEPR